MEAPRTAAELPLAYNAVDVLEGNLEARADRTALVTDERTLSFREVAAEAGRVGNALRALGVRPGDRVALLLPDGVEWVAGFFGTLKIGAVALGMNTLLTPDELVFMLRDSRARVLLTHASLLDAVVPRLGELEDLEQVVVADETPGEGFLAWDSWLARVPSECETARTHRDEPCTLNYSSGTTGEPKGIVHAHKDLPLTASLWGRDVLGLGEDDRTFAGAKLFFTFGLGGNLIFPWSAGASVVLFAGSPRQAADVLAQVVRHRPTVLYNAPTGYASMLAVEGFPGRFDVSSLRVCVSAGEALPAPLWNAWKEATGLDIVDGIGSTENFHIFVSNRQGEIRPGSSGKPVPGYDVRLVDDEGNALEEPEAVGNLWVRGETAALSYLNRYEESRRTFRGEWLVTGDKYRRDADGYLWHAGRSDDMLKVGGIWVSPVEIEGCLGEHAAVHECAVVAREDGSGLVKPEAWVVLRTGHDACDALAEELIGHCTARMAAYKRPRWVRFVAELPRTATGKVQRFRLRREDGGRA